MAKLMQQSSASFISFSLLISHPKTFYAVTELELQKNISLVWFESCELVIAMLKVT
jgi:hypothetical protein